MLCGIPKAIARSPQLKYKVLLLNTRHDRESYGLIATDFIKCVKVTDYSIISRSLNYVHALDTPGAEPFNVRDYITHVVYVRQGRIDPCVETLENLGIRCIGVDGDEADPRLDEHCTHG